MRTAEEAMESMQAHGLSGNLLSHVARGREWATPGVQAALQRAVAGLDAGIETASPRLQAILRQLADDVAAGVETFTPKVRQQLGRVGPNPSARAGKRVPAPNRTSKTWWWLAGIVALAAGAAVWRSRQASLRTEATSGSQEQEAGGSNPNVDADLTTRPR